MNISKLVRSVLKTAVYVIDQTADHMDHASDRASNFVDDAREVIYPDDNHVLRNILGFAAGIGVGLGAGLLLAPSSGSDLRASITDKVQEIGSRVKGRAENFPAASTY